MATTLIGVGATNYRHSIASTETGINVESVSCSVEPEFREQLMNYTGHVQGEAVGDSISTLTITGEVIRSTGGEAYVGLLADNFITDVTASINNLPPTFASSPITEFVLQSAETTRTRGAFETASLTYIARKNMTVANA